MMDAPVNENTGAMTKLVTLSALQAVLQAHANLGGTYIVATPSIIYNNCILKTVKDSSPVMIRFLSVLALGFRAATDYRNRS
jgi:hypothetical protein